MPELLGLRSGSLASEHIASLRIDSPHVIAKTGAGAAASADIELKFSGFKATARPPPPPACSKILYGESALWLGSGVDLCTPTCGKADAQCQYASSNCSVPPTPAQCCRACEASDNCGSWFLNGDTKICYAKVPGATNDTVTKPSTNFSAVRSIRFMYHVYCTRC